MQIKLKRLIEIDPRTGGCFDLHEEFGLARLVEENERVTLFLNSVPCRSWQKQEHPHIKTLKWLDADHVILYFDVGGAAIVSNESWENVELGFISKLFVSKSYIFVSYTDESFFRAWPTELESNIISVFSHAGHLQFGVRELFDKDRDADPLYEITAAYPYDDHIVFVGYDGKFVWILNAAQREWKKIPFEFSEVGIKFLTGDEKIAYAIYDYRHSEQQPLKLAIFDLESGIASLQDFAPVEAVLTGAGFDMNEIKFRPNSTGRIIVSDSKKAAFLEFSGLP
ncbi:MAG TPA: hypothetical protein VLZ74_02995 [Methylocella sp.]|nr:hypothetical protein [Methylocella sp.]